MPNIIRTISLNEEIWKKFKDTVARLKKRGHKITMSSVLQELMEFFIIASDQWYFYEDVSKIEKVLENGMMEER